jgi:hypothetical protein
MKEDEDETVPILSREESNSPADDPANKKYGTV